MDDHANGNHTLPGHFGAQDSRARPVSARKRTPPTDLAQAVAWMDRLRPALRRRVWPPMTSMIIPSVLDQADTLLAWLPGYAGTDLATAQRLYTELLALRADFRRDA